MKIKHYSLFTAFKSKSIDWESLRNSEVEKSYYIPFDLEDYIRIVRNEKESKSDLVNAILAFCKVYKIKKIFSIGSGRCALEYQLKMQSNLKVVVTDTSSSINRIRDFGVFDEVLQMSLSNVEDILFDDSTLILLSRIDTEFDDVNLKNLFDNLQRKNAIFLCFVPAELLTIKIFLAEFKIRVKSLLKGQKPVFCGYARTKSEYEKAWKETFIEIKNMGNKNLYFLKNNI